MCHKSAKCRAVGLGIIIALSLTSPQATANFTLDAGHGGHSQAGSATTLSYARRLQNQAFPVVRGFGHFVPLTFALRQIVPKNVVVIAPRAVTTHYIIVSWRGGVPWNVALEAALKAAGLTARITPVSVIIKIAPTQ